MQELEQNSPAGLRLKKGPDLNDSGPVATRRDYVPFSLGEENSLLIVA